jgi:hypothetical protein
MNKIASPREVVSELRGLLAYCDECKPSRNVVASKLLELANRIAAVNEVELRRPTFGVKSVSLKLEGSNPGTWTYELVSVKNNASSSYRNKDRKAAFLKMRETMRNQLDIVDTDKVLRALDEKFDSGKRVPSKSEQYKNLMAELEEVLLKNIDYDKTLTNINGSVLWVVATDRDLAKARAKVKSLGYKILKVEDNEDDVKYTKIIIADPEDLIEV